MIHGRLPSLNEYIEAGRTNRYKAAQMTKNAELLVKLSARRMKKINVSVVMHYIWTEPNRKRDKDNISSYGRKVIQDALVKCGVLKGDGWKYIEGFTDKFEVGEPKITIIFEEAKK